MSRLRFGRGSKAAGGAKPAKSSGGKAAGKAAAGKAARARGVLVPSAKSDVYVALLGISLAALVISCILMAKLLMNYEWKVSVSSAAPTPTALAPAPVQLASAATAPAAVRC